MTNANRRRIQEEFTRAAPHFGDRTLGRFDAMDVPGFAGVRPGESVLEVGAGTGNFLSLFQGDGRRLIAVDLTRPMLMEARARLEETDAVQGDGALLPFRSQSIDLVTSAQTLHHIREPLPVLKEMRRVTATGGRVLIVDQVAPESYEQMAFMDQLESLRDPSHASSRPASVMRMLLLTAGMEVIDEAMHEDRSTLSAWMWPEEFPAERIEKVRAFIERFGAETGMDFEREGDDWSFKRRRIMLLARR